MPESTSVNQQVRPARSRNSIFIVYQTVPGVELGLALLVPVEAFSSPRRSPVLSA
ncbi:hypothetical protein J2S92_003856, partial [Arthrobacter bambusae]|nr:hypothetical protein [Arthrobacter bambusae]MDQ0237398.1 hypothetical protein [Arthrobacter bambusae]